MSPTRLAIALAVAALVAFGGCVGTLGTDGGPAATTTTTPSNTTTTTSSNTTTTTTAGYGNQYVYVDPADENHSLNDSEAVAFEDLSDARQEVFLEALQEDRVAFGTDEDNPFDWNEDRPNYVRYEGEWYRVQVAIV